MSPKEKAKELVERFKPYSDYQEDDCFSEVERMLINAKQCALIAVEELIRNSFPGVIKCHWEEVKQEIEKL